MQLFWYLVILVCGLGAAVGVFGLSMQKDKSSARDKAALQLRLDDVQSQLVKFEAQQDKRTKVLMDAILATPNDTWQSIELDNIPPGVADFALMLFRTDRGRISGKVTIRGSKRETYFSTSSNDRLPVAVANAWDPVANMYRSPTFLEYAVTETTIPDARLSILTAGWIDFRQQQPHL